MSKNYGYVESPENFEATTQEPKNCETQVVTHVLPPQNMLVPSEDYSFRGPRMDLKRPIVVITNCRVGEIGHYLALQFARQRCRVVCIAPHLDMMEELVGSSFDKVASNLLDPRGIDIITEHLQKNYPRIDILMIPPSIDALGPVVEVGNYSGGWRESCNEDIAGLVYRANLLAPLCLAQNITKLLMANKMKGTVSFIGSVLGDVATPWNALFSSSMAALHALADSLRLEVAPYRIKVLLLKMGYDKSMVVNNNLPTLHFPQTSVYKSVENHVFYRAVWNKEEVESRAKIFANVAVQTTLNRHLGVHYLIESLLAPYKTVFSLSSRLVSWMIPELESHLNFFSPETNANWPCTDWVYELGDEGIGSLHSYRNSSSKLFLDWFRWDWLGLGYVSKPNCRLITIPTDEEPRIGYCKGSTSSANTLIASVQQDNSS
ncbi:NADPH-dependent 1-acyl dihydroxyacetone phosphate reductase [Entomophthora muscae]|uniref:NADPH-dependent 1-acyl dihydroxyacetone phosphate reductase n=1 Tax=Entomophthora muscae TaxID=34485 RepID=A0ACC2S2F8_9FUNG|nr:NADPH-dependent 1-acyl dihydroxyacetone phosphate reductase [Entomophthora muscae]